MLPFLRRGRFQCVRNDVSPFSSSPAVRVLGSFSKNHDGTFYGGARIKGGCDLSRGTRGKTHPQPAFMLAHLAAGGAPPLIFFQLTENINPRTK